MLDPTRSGEATTDGERALSPARLRLVGLMQHIRFGAIEGLHIVQGEPASNPPPRIVRERLFGVRQASVVNPLPDELTLKRHVVELFSEFRRIGDGVVERLEVRHGLPHRLVIATPVGAERPE